MPRRNYLKRILLLGRGWDEWDRRNEPAAKPQPAAKRSTTRRFGTALSFCALFFAGLALSAGAGNGVRALLDDGSSQQAGGGATGPTGATGASGPAPLVQAQKLVHAQVKSAQGLSVRPSATPSAQRTVQPTSAHHFGAKPARARHARPIKAAVAPAHHSSKAHGPAAKKQPLDAEADLPGATVWLYRAAPDPTPPAARLRLGFARELVADSRQAHVDWALVLAVLRVGGHTGRAPATQVATQALALKLAT